MGHLQPRVLPWQRVLRCALTPTPAPVALSQGVDGFGNHVTWIFLDTPHPDFEVILEALVDVCAPAPPAPQVTPAWEMVRDIARAGGAAGFEAAEFAYASPHVALGEEARAYAAASFPPGRPVLAGLLDMNARMGRDFKFRAGVTNLHTPVHQVLAQRAGVCQDFSHVMIAGLRALGLPARYVSGYIRTKAAPGQVRRRGADQSHAWVGCWLGPAHGWIDVDPTNTIVVKDEHVVLGWGRDFSDVSPLCGIILGGGKHRLTVNVDLEAVDSDVVKK